MKRLLLYSSDDLTKGWGIFETKFSNKGIPPNRESIIVGKIRLKERCTWGV